MGLHSVATLKLGAVEYKKVFGLFQLTIIFCKMCVYLDLQKSLCRPVEAVFLDHQNQIVFFTKNLNIHSKINLYIHIEFLMLYTCIFFIYKKDL